MAQNLPRSQFDLFFKLFSDKNDGRENRSCVILKPLLFFILIIINDLDSYLWSADLLSTLSRRSLEKVVWAPDRDQIRKYSPKMAKMSRLTRSQINSAGFDWTIFEFRKTQRVYIVILHILIITNDYLKLILVIFQNFGTLCFVPFRI